MCLCEQNILYIFNKRQFKQVRHARCDCTLIKRHVGQFHHLTVVRHADVEALLEATVLAFVTRLLVNATVQITVIVHQL